MKKVFLVHGFGGQPNGGWRPWLMSELDKIDIYACALPMPTPSTPVCSEWVEEIHRYVEKNKNDEIYLIGHSLGSPAILNFLESKDVLVSGVILISGRCINPTREETMSFYRKGGTFDFDKIKAKAKNFLVIHGNNDDVVPFENAEVMSKGLDAELIAVKDGRHLGGKDGFSEFPLVLERLIEMMK